MRRSGLVEERVDEETENYVPMTREHMDIPVWDGNAENPDTYSQDVELPIPGKRTEYRAPLGLRLVAAAPAKSAQRKLAMRPSRGTTVDENGDPVDESESHP